MERRAGRPVRNKRKRRYLSDGAHLLFVTAGAGLSGAAVAMVLLSIPLPWAPFIWLLTGFYAYAALAPVYLIVLGAVEGGHVKTSGVFLVVGSLLSALLGLGDAEAIELGQRWLEPAGVRLLVTLAWGAATCVGGLAVHHLTIRFVKPC